MVQLHYLLGDDGLQRLLIVSFVARFSGFVIGRGLHRRRRAKGAECEFEKTWWNCGCKCVSSYQVLRRVKRKSRDVDKR